MHHSELTRLMHEVLDGAASEEEARTLDRLLAADPDARAQFDDLRRLFDGLNTMPQACPPEGLAAAVTARMFDRTPRRARPGQLFSRWRVLSPYSTRARGSSPDRTARIQRASGFGSSIRNEHMSAQQKVFSGNRKLWIGAGVAAAVVAGAALYFDLQPTADTAGTIVPAQRFRAQQPGASDVNTGGPTGTTRGAQSGLDGGSNAGGSQAGGSQAGGSQAGGAQAGGAQAGGSQAGGAQAGGSHSGGSQAGGAQAGGSHSGGSQAGGAQAGGSNAAGSNNATAQH
jgi:anti-sigma factor RsiW